MTLDLVLRPTARTEMRESVEWYEKRNEGRGAQFLGAVDAALERIRKNPKVGSPIYRDYGRVRVNDYPYVLIYYITGTEIVVIAVFHASRDPDIWKARR